MKSILFLAEKLPYRKMAEQLAALTNRLTDFSVTVQILYDGEKYRNLFAGHIACRTSAISGSITTLLPHRFLYNRIVGEKYDIAIAWTEGKCVRILSGCPYPETVLYCMIHSDLSESGKFTAGFSSWSDAAVSYNRFHGFFAADGALIKPFCSVTGIRPSNVQILPPMREKRMHGGENYRQKYISPGTLQICSVGENMTYTDIHRLYKIHIQLLAEGYWHRMIVISGRKKYRFPKDTFLHLPYDTQISRIASVCDLFLCIRDDPSILDAMTDALRSGIPAVSVHSVLSESLLDHGNAGILAEDIPGIKSALRRMLTNPVRRNLYAASAAQTRKKNSSAASVQTFLACISENMEKTDTETGEDAGRIDTNRYMCYNFS